FFFQAEDGIRDRNVTGVQTCALPILPAAILLSGFAGNFSLLLTAVNLGGLGTLVASLASLISFKFYTVEYPRRKGRFMAVFTVWNLVFLGILICEALILT